MYGGSNMNGVSNVTEFLNKKSCDRCGGPLEIRIMSMMNEDVICNNCCQIEKTHPMYEEAKKAEFNEAMNGNHSYKGLFDGQKYPFED